ncbi:hypothetical protein ACFL5O_07435 [Myxococcota bacterium]
MAGTLCATLILAALPMLGAAFASACDEDATEATQGKRVMLATRLELGDDPGQPFVTATGWSVTVTRALVSLKALYYYDGEPPALVLGPSRWERLLGLRVAHAHPGHYQAGTALGEMTTPGSADLVAGPAGMADGRGITGFYRSAEIRFGAPAVGSVGDELGEHVLLVEGSARLDDEHREFRAAATAEDLRNPDGVIGVIGCGFEAAEVQGPGTIVLRIRASVWLDQVDFASVPESENGAPVELPAGSLAEMAFKHLGVTRAGAYHFEFEPRNGG